MNLHYAVNRLYETGWQPDSTMAMDALDDGRAFPSVLAVQREFARAGLDLQIKHNLMFSCYRATWVLAGEPLDDGPADGERLGGKEATAADSERLADDERRGTVVAACDREAAVYALAQLRGAGRERELAMA